MYNPISFLSITCYCYLILQTAKQNIMGVCRHHFPHEHLVFFVCLFLMQNHKLDVCITQCFIQVCIQVPPKIRSWQRHCLSCECYCISSHVRFFWSLFFGSLNSSCSVCFCINFSSELWLWWLWWLWQLWNICHWRLRWVCKCVGWKQQEKIISGKMYIDHVWNMMKLQCYWLWLFCCSIPSTRLALQRCPSAEMVVCSLLRPATHLRRGRYRKSEFKIE